MFSFEYGGSEEENDAFMVQTFHKHMKPGGRWLPCSRVVETTSVVPPLRTSCGWRGG